MGNEDATTLADLIQARRIDRELTKMLGDRAQSIMVMDPTDGLFKKEEQVAIEDVASALKLAGNVHAMAEQAILTLAGGDEAKTQEGEGEGDAEEGGDDD